MKMRNVLLNLVSTVAPPVFAFVMGVYYPQFWLYWGEILVAIVEIYMVVEMYVSKGESKPLQLVGAVALWIVVTFQLIRVWHTGESIAGLILYPYTIITILSGVYIRLWYRRR